MPKQCYSYEIAVRRSNRDHAMLFLRESVRTGRNFTPKTNTFKLVNTIQVISHISASILTRIYRYRSQKYLWNCVNSQGSQMAALNVSCVSFFGGGEEKFVSAAACIFAFGAWHKRVSRYKLLPYRGTFVIRWQIWHRAKTRGNFYNNFLLHFGIMGAWLKSPWTPPFITTVWYREGWGGPSTASPLCREGLGSRSADEKKARPDRTRHLHWNPIISPAIWHIIANRKFGGKFFKLVLAIVPNWHIS